MVELFDAELFVEDAVAYLFLMTGEEVVGYEVTAGNLLRGRVVYDKGFFGVDRIHVRHLVKGGKN